MKPVSPPPAPPFERYAAALAALPADERSRPLGLLDLDAFRANAAALHARAGAVPVRVASKSVRIRRAITEALDQPGFTGIMAYSLTEALWWVESGRTDVLVAYPTTDEAALTAWLHSPAARGGPALGRAHPGAGARARRADHAHPGAAPLRPPGVRGTGGRRARGERPARRRDPPGQVPLHPGPLVPPTGHRGGRARGGPCRGRGPGLRQRRRHRLRGVHGGRGCGHGDRGGLRAHGAGQLRRVPRPRAAAGELLHAPRGATPRGRCGHGGRRRLDRLGRARRGPLPHGRVAGRALLLQPGGRRRGADAPARTRRRGPAPRRPRVLPPCQGRGARRAPARRRGVLAGRGRHRGPLAHVPGRGQDVLLTRPLALRRPRSGRPGLPARRTWSGGHAWSPAREARPESVPELADVVGAAAQAGLRVKPIGAGHSFSPIAATDGVQLDLSALSGLSAVDREGGRVRVLAGTPLHQLGPLLGAHGLALANMGDIDRQSVGGALSTATHGTGLGFTGYGGMVTGLRLVTADGAVRWADADHEPDLFQAARVGLGALGVITEVELRTVPAFLLHARERREPLDAVVESFVERSRAADHLEFSWFPGTDLALTKENTRLPLTAGIDPVDPVRTAVMDGLLSNGVFGGMCRLGARAPRLVPLLNQVSARGVDQRTYTDVSYRVFVAERAVRFREMEYAVPLERFEEAFAGLRRIAAERAAAGDAVSFPVEVRTVAADDVWLSTAHGRESAYLAVHRYHREDPTAYFAAAEELFVSLGGRPHWGKEHDRDAEWAARAYPRFADFTAQRDAVDPGRVFANPYLERVLGA